MMAPDEILVRVVDRALDEYFKRDKLWRKDREMVLREAQLSRWRALGLRSTASPDAATSSAMSVGTASAGLPSPSAGQPRPPTERSR
jgi:hypothetical protein